MTRKTAHIKQKQPYSFGMMDDSVFAGLDPRVTNVARVADCLKPFDPKLMKKYPVSVPVNRTENDDEECAREAPIASTAPRLF